MSNEEQKYTDTKKCIRCKKDYDISLFIKDDKELKKCKTCRDKNRLICIICNVKTASFNSYNETIPKYCVSCKEVGMINIISSKCFVCKNKIPTFNKLGNKKATHCVDCKESDMVDVLHTMCIKCKYKIPVFNNQDEKKGLYCLDCKEPDMINVVDKKCIKCNKRRPSFNTANETTALYCSDCKESDMVDIKNKKCIKCLKKNPIFNNPNEKKPLYCKDCKSANMVDVKNFKCIKCNIKQPTYNTVGEKKPTYCLDCKTSDMVDIVNKKCIKCKEVRPNYALDGQKIPTHCNNCKEDNMIDVTHRQCIIDKCSVRPYYGYCGQSPIYCATHRDNHTDKNFLYTRPKRRCIGNNDEECKDIAEYGKTEPIHCLEHKAEDEIYLVAQKCSQCCKNDLLNKDGLCITYCAPNQLYQQVKKEKKQEMIVMNYLDKNVKIENIINIQDDKVVDTYCNYYRPDRIYDVGTHCIIIEVDEEQHKGKRASCSKGDIGELARMHEIQNAIGINCIFIRFNPDSFKVNNKIQKISINQRLNLLVKWIEKCAEMKPVKDLQPVKYKYLYYDEWNETDTSFQEIDDTKLYDK
jgi:hypothetical protein